MSLWCLGRVRSLKGARRVGSGADTYLRLSKNGLFCVFEKTACQKLRSYDLNCDFAARGQLTSQCCLQKDRYSMLNRATPCAPFLQNAVVL
jgi:hypothetical protein